MTAKEETKSNSIFNEMKLLVFWSCLKPLLNWCLTCPVYATISNFFAKGRMLIVTLFCLEGHESTWRSQPNLDGMAAGNLFLSAATLFTGNTFQRIQEFMKIANIYSISHTNNIQKMYSFPAIYITNFTHN